ncbi:thermonuclease family protein [Roseobacter sinensis]|uniref:Thermonuclease family protein n=1 Tax=Roseobacter sinensis TaxID=2931391 RepID=A0ABT3BIB6_9RHOB|nr:thermonuclease family protein [Roseobacter sp. WL0113]MCV3272963.1 thermonuclease family protein [Roseobacter sp. WL0113]
MPAPGAALATTALSGPVRVVDGDTFDVGGTPVRLFGIDAPEADQTCTTDQGQTWACGAWVTDQVTTRYAGRVAHCAPVTRDRYDRVVARCEVDDEDVGAALVGDGLAFAYRRYAQDYVLAEKGAAVRNVGLHASRVQDPSEFRRARAAGSAPVVPGCAIKGNISRSGVKIYHQPGQRDYDRTRIRQDNGERWFCSAAEAQAAGWRAARR